MSCWTYDAGHDPIEQWLLVEQREHGQGAGQADGGTLWLQILQVDGERDADVAYQLHQGRERAALGRGRRGRGRGGHRTEVREGGVSASQHGRAGCLGATTRQHDDKQRAITAGCELGFD